MAKGGNQQPAIDSSEHIGPEDTGDNINAKRAANYAWNPNTSQWVRESTDANGYSIVSLGNLISGEDTTNNALRIEGIGVVYAGLSAAGLSEDLVPATDISNFSEFSIQVEGTFSGTLTVQGSNDGNTWRTTTVESANIGSAIKQTTVSSGSIFKGYRNYRWLRIRFTAYTSGTATGTLVLFSQPSGPSSGVSASQTGIWTQESRGTSTAPTVTAVASAATDTTLKASNTSRRGLFIFNDADKALYVKLGTSASTTSFTKKIPAGGEWEVPKFPIYTGQINGIWETSPTGNALVTEILA